MRSPFAAQQRKLRRVIARAGLRARASREGSLLLLLTGLAVLLGGLTVAFGPALFPVSAQTLPLAAGGLRLRVRLQRALVGVVALSALVSTLAQGLAMVRPGALVVVAFMSAATLALASGRESLGITGNEGTSMLGELQQRLQAQGELPPLPPGWKAEVVLRPAGGAGFAGDFNVSALTEGGGRLELALVDVSGKGVDAGTRSLLLSGALGGLLGALDRSRFLSAATGYLVSQDWDEGFATAVHVSLELATGAYEVRCAGHPPAAHFDAGSGRWSLSPAEGPALGLLDDIEYPAEHGVLRPGDALLLYTDGLVEVPGRDLTVGIDKLLGEAERLVPRGFAGGAKHLVEKVPADRSDDRALLLLWREA